MDTNDIAVHPATRQIILGDCTTCEYEIAMSTSGAHAIHCTQARILHASNKSTTSWSGEFIDLHCKDPPDCELALEPPNDCAVNSHDQQNNVWPLPSTVSIVAGKIRIPNDTDSPLILQRNKHLLPRFVLHFVLTVLPLSVKLCHLFRAVPDHLLKIIQ